MGDIQKNREFMKSNFAQMRGVISDQQKGKALPAFEKPTENGKEIISLPKIDEMKLEPVNLINLIQKRKSHRKYLAEEITLKELSFLLWTTQGVKEIFEVKGKPYVTKRTVPSAGSRHPFETYLFVNNVESLKKGLYRYLPLEHKVIFLGKITDQEEKITTATVGQRFCAEAAALFVWSCLPYRGEWRYHKMAHKPMLLDAGHICQNLYLGCEVIKAGTCAIAAYDQEKIDELIGVDGKDEFTVYLAPIGKIARD